MSPTSRVDITCDTRAANWSYVTKPDFLRLDRAIGAVMASAVGDALGAGYEFVTAPSPDNVVMRPGTLTHEPAGHWTDDTAMALAVVEVAAARGTLLSDDALDDVAQRFLDWYRSGPLDVGNQTRAVLSRAATSSELRAVALEVLADDPTRAGNGSLMRTGPVALAHLGNDAELARAASLISALTHPNPLATDACVLWTIAIDRAVRLASLEGPRAGLPMIDAERRDQWAEWIDEAEANDPRRFSPNGFVVRALQAAWSAIYATREEPQHLVAALRRCVSIGDDTDTVAAIAGALLGARYGISSVPFAWRFGLAGWPRQYRSRDLLRLAVLAARGGEDDDQGWPSTRSLSDYYRQFSPTGLVVTFPVDDAVTFGDVASLPDPTADVVISLCRVGLDDVPALENELVWLLDDDGNADVARVLADTADGIAWLRQRGKSVFVHCVRAESRTPAVAMAWLTRHHGRSVDDAIAEVSAAMSTCRPHPSLLKGVRESSTLPPLA